MLAFLDTVEKLKKVQKFFNKVSSKISTKKLQIRDQRSREHA